MPRNRPFKNAHKLVERYRVTHGRSFRLAERAELAKARRQLMAD